MITRYEEAVETLGTKLAGALLQPGEKDYEAACRLWNGMIDKRPALIARCLTPEDVAASIRYARAHDLEVAVRGGGHNVAGSALCDGGLVIDLSAMRTVRVDAPARRAWAEGGVTIGELDRATQAHGLATPMGVVTETGIAGLTLGGGMGWLRRKHGLSCDALRSAEVVLADGQCVRASEAEHADLFWAIRGGGGNFGVVTRFEFELYEVGPEVFFLGVFYPIEAAGSVLRFMRAHMADAADAFSPIAVIGHMPPLPDVPEARHGEPMVALLGPYAGPIEDGTRVLAPLRQLATPIVDLSGPMPYVDVQQFFDEDYPSGGRYYWKSANLKVLSDAAVERLVALNDAAPSPHATMDLWFQGGAMGRVAPEATAFGDRSTPVLLGVEANWHAPEEDEANVAWVRRSLAEMKPFSGVGLYLNFPGFAEEGEHLVRAAYGANYERLAAVKRRYDPDNVFRTHQSIIPTP